ncbi:MAG: transporter substrate-binding domain-containing protein [Bacteroidota bacterium]
MSIAIHEHPPFIIKTEEGNFEGLSIELWNNIAEELQLKYEFHYYHDLVSIIKDLEFQEVDLTINPMSVTPLRLQRFEATQPYFISSIGIAVPYAQQSQLRIFLRNFFSVNFFRVVLLLIFIIFIFGTLLWLVERKENQGQFRSGLLGLLDGLWWSAVTMTTVGYGDKAPKTIAGKSIAIVWMFTAIIIISGFTATIASTLTIGSLEANIEKLEDLKLASSLASVGTSTGEDFLFRNKITPQITYQNPLQGLRALAKQETDVLVYDQTILSYLINTYQLGDKVTLLPISFNKQYESFLFPKKHPSFRAINVALVKQMQETQWQQLLKKYSLRE